MNIVAVIQRVRQFVRLSSIVKVNEGRGGIFTRPKWRYLRVNSSWTREIPQVFLPSDLQLTQWTIDREEIACS